ncbi:MAG: metallophosphoesterase [Candidatus Hydrogenedentes bacterium]|nr:metallophosphoesterase [Candidatus Hydrogenedentota bacterium]
MAATRIGKPILILHLSDLHLGKHSRFPEKDLEHVGKTLGQAAIAEAQRRKTGKVPDLVIVSGDLVETGHKDEFKLVGPFLNALAEALSVDGAFNRSKFIFLPGNHDISWNACKIAELQHAEGEFPESELLARMNAVKLRLFDDFVKEYTGKDRGAAGTLLSYGAFVHDFSDLRLSVAALNSCEDLTHRQLAGGISEQQAEALMKHWRGDTEAWLKVAVVHHNPRPVPPQCIEDWKRYLTGHAADGKLPKEHVDHFFADALGFDQQEMLKRTLKDRQVQLLLHGHQHEPSWGESWNWNANGVTHVLAAGSAGLSPDKMPNDQPNHAQLITLEPDARKIRAWSLVYDPRSNAAGAVKAGSFVFDGAFPDGYEHKLDLPANWTRNRATPPKKVSKGKDLTAFLATYREAFRPVYNRWDLRTAGAVQQGGADKPIDATLENMYLPLRLAEGFNINKLEEGTVLQEVELLSRTKHLAITGPAGSGKTTWMRHTFTSLIDEPDALPIMLELRGLVADWAKSDSKPKDRSLDCYFEQRVAQQVGETWGGAITGLLSSAQGPRPILLVDGWDELGSQGEDLRKKLLGFLGRYKRVSAVVSSRPYGEGQPSWAEGFEGLDIQPLNNPEIEQFATSFFTHCYRGDAVEPKKQVDGFMEALEASAGAQPLARTPLLLTMMLLISRSSPLPDKRHQLYDKCLENLLTAIPKRYEAEFGQLGFSQWRPDDGEERIRVVCAMAAALQGGKGNLARLGQERIAVSWDEMAELFPDWEKDKKFGFLTWLVERAGVLDYREDGRLSFAHLSFQEYGAARHFKAMCYQDDAVREAFTKRAPFEFWWETLRLWAALLDSENRERVNGIIVALAKSQSGLSLTGAMLSDGLVDDGAVRVWAAAYASRLKEGWIDACETCAQAWAGSRQDARKQIIFEVLELQARESTWMQWTRCRIWSEMALGKSIALPNHETNAFALLWFCHNGTLDERSVAAGRILVNGDSIWPGFEDGVGLLQLWPGDRRLAGLRLQALANQGIGFDGLLKSANTVLAIPPWDEARRYFSRYFSRGFSRGLSLDLSRYFSRDFSRYFSRDISRDISRDLTFYFSSNYSRNFFRDLSRGISRYSSRDISRYFSRDLSRDLSRYFSRGISRYLSRDFSALYLAEMYGLAESDYSFMPSDLMADELFCHGRIGLPSLLTLVKVLPDDLRVKTLAMACRLIYASSKDDIGLKSVLRSYPAHYDPLWPALARHIAGIGTPEDRALLEDLARHPEKREGPLQWGLRYIVRGDVVLDDGTVVTLDELSAAHGLEPLPYLEEMPERFEVDWDDDVETPEGNEGEVSEG